MMYNAKKKNKKYSDHLDFCLYHINYYRYSWTRVMMNKKTERKISNRKMYQNSLSQMPHRYKIVQDMMKRLKKNSYLHTYNMLFAFEYKTRVFELSALSELKLYQVGN